MPTVNEEAAEDLKKEGHSAYNAGDYQRAIDCYTQALDMDFSYATLLNRSQAHLKLKKFGFAYVDANEVLRNHDAENVKCLILRARARMELGFEKGAVDDLEKAKELAGPSDDKIPQLLKTAKERLATAEAERIPSAEKIHELLKTAEEKLATAEEKLATAETDGIVLKEEQRDSASNSLD